MKYSKHAKKQYILKFYYEVRKLYFNKASPIHQNKKSLLKYPVKRSINNNVFLYQSITIIFIKSD